MTAGTLLQKPTLARPPVRAGSDGTAGGPGGTALASSVGNVSSAYANAGSGSPFGDVRSSTVEYDLCRPWGIYSGAVPGADITAQLQAMVTALVVAGAAVEFYFSIPGSYNINGARQHGYAGGRAYAGQIVLPAISWGAANGATVRIRGTVNPGTNDASHEPAGVILNSNAGAASIGTLSAPLTTGGAITSLPVSALSEGINAGTAIKLDDGAGHTQVWNVWQQVAPAATAVPVLSQTPSFAFPASTTNVNSPTNVFSVIPAGSGTYPDYSNLTAIVEDLCVQLPTDPQSGGIDFSNSWQGATDRVMVRATVPGTAASLTGAGLGVLLPKGSNGGWSPFRDSFITNLPFGVSLGDHGFIGGGTFFTNCGVAITGHNGPPAYLDRAYAMGCLVGIQPDGAGQFTVDGTLGWEGTGSTNAMLFNDPGTNLRGYLRVRLGGDTPELHSSLPAIGGQGSGNPHGFEVNLANTLGDANGTRDSHPSDSFLRLKPAATTAALPGLCSETLHLWRIDQGSISAITQGAANGSWSFVGGVNGAIYVPVKRGGIGGESRSITVNYTTPATLVGGVFLRAQKPVGGANNGKGFQVGLSNNTFLQLSVNGVAVANGGTIAVSTSYSVTLNIIVNSAGTPTRAIVLLGGVEVIDYPVSASQAAAMLASPATTNYPFLEDGLSTTADTTTVITGYYTRSAVGDDVVNRTPTVALVQGSTVAPDTTQGGWQTLTFTTNANLTLSNPTNPPGSFVSQVLTIEVFNNSGGAMGVIAWGTRYVFNGFTWVNPANGLRRFATFRWNGTNWICTSIAGADY